MVTELRIATRKQAGGIQETLSQSRDVAEVMVELSWATRPRRAKSTEQSCQAIENKG